MTDASKRGKASNAKGKRFERWLVRELRKFAAPPQYATKVRRGLQDRSGSDDPDVIMPHLWIEAKHGRKPNIRGAMRQAIEASGVTPAGRIKLPVAVTRDNRKEPLVTMHLGTLCNLLRRMPGEWWET